MERQCECESQGLANPARLDRLFPRHFHFPIFSISCASSSDSGGFFGWSARVVVCILDASNFPKPTTKGKQRENHPHLLWLELITAASGCILPSAHPFHSTCPLHLFLLHNNHFRQCLPINSIHSSVRLSFTHFVFLLFFPEFQKKMFGSKNVLSFNINPQRPFFFDFFFKKILFLNFARFSTIHFFAFFFCLPPLSSF